MKLAFRTLCVCGSVAIATASAGCTHSTSAAPLVQGKTTGSATPAPTEVAVVKPERKTVRRTTDQPGRIEAFEETPIFSKISGYAGEPKADIGDRVEKGQPLVELWAPELDLELKQREAAFTQAKAEQAQADAAVKVADAGVTAARAKVVEVAAATKRADAEIAKWESQLKRDERLARTETIEPKILDETRNQFHAAEAARDEVAAKVESAKATKLEADAKVEKAKADVTAAAARVAVAEADRDRARVMLDYATINAPYDGVITARNVNTNTFIPATGTREPLFVIMRADPVRVFVDVREQDAARVKDGARAVVRIQSLGGKDIEATVTRSAGVLKPPAWTLRTEIDLANPDGKLLPGMYAYAFITIEEHADALTIPATALVKQGDKMFCCVVAGSKILRKPVTVGINDGTLAEITSGLSGDEAVVKANAGSLNDGQAVQVAGASK